MTTYTKEQLEHQLEITKNMLSNSLLSLDASYKIKQNFAKIFGVDRENQIRTLETKIASCETKIADLETKIKELV